MEKNEQAIKSFSEGFNCAQAVFCTFCEIPGDISALIAMGFGGGIAGLQKTCGAVTGGIMAIGYQYGNAGKEAVYEKTLEFIERFKSIYGSVECIDIIKYDTSTPDGREKARAENARENTCVKCVGDAVSIIENLNIIY